MLSKIISFGKISHFFLLLGIVCSCSSLLSRQTLSTHNPDLNTGDVIVFEHRDDIPPGADKLGSITLPYANSYYEEDGTFDVIMDLAKQKATTMGGNSFFIVSHIPPTSTRAFHTLRVDIYNSPDVGTSFKGKECSHPEYASVWLYRYGGDPQWEYSVYIDDNRVLWSKANTIKEVRFYQPGTHEIWAMMNNRASLLINISLGKDYYVEMSSTNSGFAVIPWLFQVSDYAGIEARTILKND